MTDLKLHDYTIEYMSFGRKAFTVAAYCPALFAADSAEYSHAAARLSAQMATVSYDMSPRRESAEKSGIYRCLSALGFEQITCYPETGRREVDSVFAYTDITAGGEAYRLIFCCFVGSRYAQWYENFDSGTAPLHKGFEACEAFAFAKLQQFLKETGSGEKALKFWIIGHSRGGATANLLAARLIRGNLFAANRHVFCYTFAAPSCYSGADRSGEPYRRIFNIINEEDFVTRCMPRAWGYGRYGRSLTLPNSRDCEAYADVLQKTEQRYAEMTNGVRFYPFRKGPATVDKVVNGIFGGVKNVEDYYSKKFRCGKRMLSVQEYFAQTLCAVTGERSGTPPYQAGFKLMLDTVLRRFSYDKVFRSAADFFVFYEGIGGATKGKISKNYFTFSHDMAGYCAMLLSTAESQLKEEKE